MRTSTHTLQKGIEELRTGASPGEGRIRKPGGGRKAELPRHPEWTEMVKVIIEPFTAGLPQDENVVWISLTAPQIARLMKGEGCEVSVYHVRLILEQMGFRRRSFLKDLPMKEVEHRDAQFVKIAETRKALEEIGVPVISIDTKKKEMVGNFARGGKVLAKGKPKSLDHDFATFSDGQIVPHGIYDVARNEGYITIGTSHDTSKFVCDNIRRVWREHLLHMYPDAQTIAILCDGGGSNSSSHHIVKQDLMDLANDLGRNILVMHYPPYCSKYNPIEHRLFSHLNRCWQGEPLRSVENAAKRAALTSTSTGLSVHVDLNTKTYDIKRPLYSDYKDRLSKQLFRAKVLPQWNYLIKPII